MYPLKYIYENTTKWVQLRNDEQAQILIGFVDQSEEYLLLIFEGF